MTIKRNFLLLTLLLIIILQTLLFTNNNQKTSFRYLKWTAQEVSLGKLISISFFSGLLISTLLINTITSKQKNTLKNFEENYEPLDNEEDMKSDIKMPPQRDIRDSQPTISVNYRVVKNSEDIKPRKDQNYSDSSNKEDDWYDGNVDW